MANEDRGHLPSEERSISRLEQIELAAKVAAGLVAITYVSGYLIETTYLGSFGMHADAIEFFRAKYLYIGFHFWFCVSAFVVFLISAKRFYDFIHSWLRHNQANEMPTGNGNGEKLTQVEFDSWVDLTVEERNEARLMESHRNVPGDPFVRPSFGALRWSLIVSSVVLVFSLQVMLLNRIRAARILPFQFLLLISMGMHQFTHFRENYSFWGVVKGRMHVSRLRLLGMTAQVTLALAIALLVLSPPSPGTLFHLILTVCFWIFAIPFTLLAVLLPFSIFKQNRQMSRFDLRKNEELGFIRRECRWLFGWGGEESPEHPAPAPAAATAPRWQRVVWFALKLLTSLVILALLCDAVLLAAPRHGIPYSWIVCFLHRFLKDSAPGWKHSIWRVCFGGIGILTLLLMFYVPLNIYLLARMRKEMHRRLGVRAPDSPHRDEFSTEFLRVVTVTTLYLVSVMTFSHIVYPRIPEEKAGGSYTGARLAQIHLVRGATLATCGAAPADSLTHLLGGTAQSEDSAPDSVLEHGEGIVLEEDANWLYLAELKAGNCPEDWAKNMIQIERDMRHSRPTFFAINRSCIEFVTYSERLKKRDLQKMPKDYQKNYPCPARDDPPY